MQTWNIDAKDLAVRAPELRTGDRVLLSGVIYTARDAAHKRLMASIHEGGTLPFPLEGSAIYFAGPTPAPEGMAIGSCGPTTSSRMDPFTPKLMDLGLTATIGKGVYLCSIGGAGALAALCIKACEVIAYDDLGCESIKRLRVEAFPLIVAADSTGTNLFDSGRAAYRIGA